jgi:hypothetical protein
MVWKYKGKCGRGLLRPHTEMSGLQYESVEYASTDMFLYASVLFFSEAVRARASPP